MSRSIRTWGIRRRRSGAPAVPALLAAVVAGALATVLALGGCTAAPPAEETPTPTAGSHGTRNLVYATASGKKLQLNACLPRSDAATPAVILLHGGGFQSGGKESMMGICRELAASGFAAFSIDYRLMPNFPYPAQVDDVKAAISWLREPAQVKRFELDPARVALFGSSAGAIIAATQGVAGEGTWTTGDKATATRVAAVVALSPAVDLTASGLKLGKPGAAEVRLILAYLGCESPESCPDARAASPLYAVDPTDPPFYIAASTAEIVPEQQAQAMNAALEKAGVPVTLDLKAGSKHAISLLDSTTTRAVLAFLHSHLDAPR
ncbi:alpha/beta hydrolase [Glaciibacter sp. 2TAF33]|uniref:alpha/beta hydrolase n=1 Tax=Glaciibacter sp. 2TAF33 TaxID=3233015 RepID=UPI003F8DBFA7